MVLYVSAASRFVCVAILDLYFSEYLLISSLTVGIPRSLRMSSFLIYQGAFTIVLRILACIVSILFIWLIVAVNSYYRGETRSLEYASTRVVNSRYD